MSVIVRNHLRRRGWATVMMTLMIALTATIGFCLFDGDHDDSDHHGASHDLCLSMLFTSLAVILLTGLVPSGWAVTYRPASIPIVGLRVPSPPPKSTLLA
jgi:hypothetical protein